MEVVNARTFFVESRAIAPATKNKNELTVRALATGLTRLSDAIVTVSLPQKWNIAINFLQAESLCCSIFVYKKLKTSYDRIKMHFTYKIRIVKCHVCLFGFISFLSLKKTAISVLPHSLIKNTG
jgi:hypothetical protein